MSRITSRGIAILAAAVLLSASGSLLAQVTPGPGQWSAAHPLWWDDGDGTPESGELMSYAAQNAGTKAKGPTDCTQVINYPTSVGPSESPCASVTVGGGVSGTMSRPSTGTDFAMSTNSTGTHFDFLETLAPIKPASGGSRAALAPSALASGTGDLLDISPPDGLYDTLRVVGANQKETVQADVSLLPRDVTGDGRPDYVTVPWTTGGAGVLGVAVGSTPQIYIPLTDTNADGWPDTVTVLIENGGPETTTGPPVSGPALRADLNAIPSASGLGLFFFAAAVVVLGLKLLRGTIATA